jgi:hypothetical protein
MVMSISDRMAAVVESPVQAAGRMRVVPLIGPSESGLAYVLFTAEVAEAIAVEEVSESGQVPYLKLTNKLDQRVFLMDGQELIGAKQNRILNTDVLVGAKQTVTLPVSCVERGRWSMASRRFVPGRAASSSVRQSKLKHVRRSLEEGKGHRSDQGEVWKEVDKVLHNSEASSGTDALHAAYQHRERDLDKLRASLKLPAEAVGLAVFHGNQFRGLDLFDRHSTLAAFWDRIVDSYGIEWIGEAMKLDEPTDHPDAVQVRQHLATAAAGSWKAFAAVGEGVDHRLSDPSMEGAALIWDDRVVVHLQLFPA